MTAALIRWSIGNRFLVLMATAFVVLAGVWWGTRQIHKKLTHSDGH